jgi:cytochrome P450
VNAGSRRRDTTTVDRPVRRLPGPRGMQLIGVFGSLLGKELLQPFQRLGAAHGPLFGVPLPFGQRLVMVAHPDAVEHVLRSGRDNYVKGSVYDGTRLLLGQGLVTSEGALWRRQRELANPAFRPAKLQDYVAVMADCTAQLMADWHAARHAGPVNAQREMTRLTLAIVGRTLFGLDLSQHSERAAAAFGTALAAIGRRGPGNLQLPLWLPTPGNRRFRHTLDELDTLIYEVISRFRAGQAENAAQTLLGAYLESRDPATGAGMDDRQLRDEVITLYLAGHETTASLLSWALYRLSRSPEIQARVVAEIDARLSDEVPSLEQLKGLQYTSQVIHEVLRLYPPAWTIARNALADDEVMGYHVPAGAIVMVSPYFTQRLEAFWPQPLRFDPDRFAPPIVATRHPFAYFPFSLGPRICIGMQFALHEARLVLGMLLRQFEIHPVNGSEVGACAAGTLRPNRTLNIRLQPR